MYIGCYRNWSYRKSIINGSQSCFCCNFIEITNTNLDSNGGAIEFTNTVNVTLTSCLFRRNTAYKHGGVISLKTSGSIVIQSCTFEDNKASSSSSSASLLDEKTQCRGGAIFLTQVSGSSSPINIDGCTFKTNIAHDAYAIYIELEESESTATVTYTISNNKFINNYNGDSSSSSCTGSNIASEITTITTEDIEQSNTFEASIYGQGCQHFYHVDVKGDKLPDPTAKPDPTVKPYPTVKPDPSYPGSNIIDFGTPNEESIDRCEIIKDPTKEDEQNMAVHVLSTKFEKIDHDEGVAIHLENC